MPNAKKFKSYCVQTICACEEKGDSGTCGCSFMAELSRFCVQADIRITEWRSENFCPPTRCPANMIWSESGEKCADSCVGSRLHLPTHARSQCSPNHFEGCTCPPALFFREDGVCVTRRRCGCEFQGQIYDEGYVRKFEAPGTCQRCLCRDNVWQCDEVDECDRECKTAGAGHVDTFDGTRFSHHSHGEFVFAFDKENSEWEILVEYENFSLYIIL